MGNYKFQKPILYALMPPEIYVLDWERVLLLVGHFCIWRLECCWHPIFCWLPLRKSFLNHGFRVSKSELLSYLSVLFTTDEAEALLEAKCYHSTEMGFLFLVNMWIYVLDILESRSWQKWIRSALSFCLICIWNLQLWSQISKYENCGWKGGRENWRKRWVVCWSTVENWVSTIKFPFPDLICYDLEKTRSVKRLHVVPYEL